MPGGYRTADGYDLNDLWYGGPGGGPGIRAAVDHYRMVDLPLMRALAMPWGNTILKYGVSEKNGFQPLGFGQRPDRKLITMATIYPIVNKNGYAVGTDLDTLQMSTGKEAQLDLARPFKEDPEFVLQQYLKVMLTDPGSNNVGYGWYNGQFAAEEMITAPPRFQNNTFAANHAHYYGINNATWRLSDITKAKQTIRHHGNNGPLVGFLNSVDVQALEDLAAWTSTSIIRSPISDEVSINGFQDTFRLLDVTFHVTEMMPADYMLIVEALGAEQDRPLIHFEPDNMKGLELHPGPQQDYPLIESYFTRWIGVKVARRGSGVAIQRVGSATYTNPTLD